MRVLRAVAVQHQVLDGDVGDVLAGEHGKQRRDGGLADPPEVLSQSLVELEAVAAARHERAFHNVHGAPVGILRPQANAVADFEPLGVGQRDLLVEPVAILRPGWSWWRLFDEHRLRAAAQQADLGLQIDRVPQAIGAGRIFTVPPPNRATYSTAA